MAEIFGLDLGTTNTLAAIRYAGGAEASPFLEGGRPHPSVVRYQGSNVLVGRAARDLLEAPEVGVVGNFVRSPKRYLGTGTDLYVGGVPRDPSEVVADLLRHVRSHAEDRVAGGVKFDSVVATIPVTMDGRGRRAYRTAAQMAGFNIYQFIHEPLAALYGWLRRGTDSRRRTAELEGRMVLVFDWGGGTLDLTLCRVTGGSIIQIHNIGDADVGGDRFDERLMRLVQERHLEKHGLAATPEIMPGALAKLNVACELAKIRLSRMPTAEILIPHYANLDDPGQILEERISRGDLEMCSRDLVDRGLGRIDELLTAANVSAEAIDLCLSTGGMIQMPVIRARLIERFGGPGRVPLIENGDRMMAEGAAWVASDEQTLTLAKPFEVLHADNTYVPLLDAETTLPTVGRTLSVPFSMYCADPRDGFARFLFARPASPDRTSLGDTRNPYGIAVLAVDPTALPLRERLDMEVSIDEDLVVHVDMKSSLARGHRVLNLPNLEFGLHLGQK